MDGNDVLRLLRAPFEPRVDESPKIAIAKRRLQFSLPIHERWDYTVYEAVLNAENCVSTSRGGRSD
jgi:hypothetical protein